MCDISDGTVWGDENPDDHVLQIIGYYELTLSNPLMSKSKKYKIGMFLYVVVCSN